MPTQPSTKVVRNKPPAAGKGRPKGALNKATREFRETVTLVLAANAENVGKWLLQVAEGSKANDIDPDPARALDLLAKLAEFAAPKLGRTEHVGPNGGPVETITRIEMVAARGNRIA